MKQHLFKRIYCIMVRIARVCRWTKSCSFLSFCYLDLAQFDGISDGYDQLGAFLPQLPVKD